MTHDHDNYNQHHCHRHHYHHHPPPSSIILFIIIISDRIIIIIRIVISISCTYIIMHIIIYAYVSEMSVHRILPCVVVISF